MLSRAWAGQLVLAQLLQRHVRKLERTAYTVYL
jgi:hypothetical protein